MMALAAAVEDVAEVDQAVAEQRWGGYGHGASRYGGYGSYGHGSYSRGYGINYFSFDIIINI